MHYWSLCHRDMSTHTVHTCLFRFRRRLKQYTITMTIITSSMATPAPMAACILGLSKGVDALWPDVLPGSSTGQFIPSSFNKSHSSLVVIKTTPFLSWRSGRDPFGSSLSWPPSWIFQTAARKRSLLCFRSMVISKLSRYSEWSVARFLRRRSKQQIEKLQPWSNENEGWWWKLSIFRIVTTAGDLGRLTPVPNKCSWDAMC